MVSFCHCHPAPAFSSYNVFCGIPVGPCFNCLCYLTAFHLRRVPGEGSRLSMLVRAAGNVLKGLSGAHMGMERWVRRPVLSFLSCHHGLMTGSHGKVWSRGVGLHLEARWKDKGILLLLPCPHWGGGVFRDAPGIGYPPCAGNLGI